MSVRKVETMDALFSLRQIHESAGLEGLPATDESEDYPYFETDGWHFYSISNSKRPRRGRNRIFVLRRTPLGGRRVRL